MLNRSLSRPWPVLLLSLGLILSLAVTACEAPDVPEPDEPAPAEEVVAEPEEEAEEEEEAEAQDGADESVLRVALDVPVQLDPAFASSDSEIAVLNAVYDYLVDIDANNRILPRLAKSWVTASDGLTWTFDLEEDAAFHDGTPVTAEDVIWTFNRLRDPEAELPTADLFSNIAGISATGDHQVTFRLAETNPFFLYRISDNHALILKAGTEDPETAFNGSGPFEVVDYRPEDRMELVANEDYFVPDQPGVDRLELIFFREQDAAVDALRGGQVDVVTRMPASLFLALEDEPGIETWNVPTNGFDLVRLRSDRPPGDDPRVIQALKLATDRAAIIDVVTQGLAAEGRDSPIGPLYTRYFTATPLPERDVEAARELLAAAGYEDGLSLEMHVPDTGDRPDLAVVLKEQWAEAGVDIEVIVEPESIYYGEDKWLEETLGITGWGSRPVPQFYLDVMLVCGAKWNESAFCDEEFDELAALAATTLDDEERAAAYTEIQQILVDRGPVIIPYYFAQLGAMRDTFEGFELKAFAGRTDLAAITPAE